MRLRPSSNAWRSPSIVQNGSTTVCSDAESLLTGPYTLSSTKTHEKRSYSTHMLRA